MFEFIFFTSVCSDPFSNWYDNDDSICSNGYCFYCYDSIRDDRRYAEIITLDFGDCFWCLVFQKLCL